MFVQCLIGKGKTKHQVTGFALQILTLFDQCHVVCIKARCVPGVFTHEH